LRYSLNASINVTKLYPSPSICWKARFARRVLGLLKGV